MDNYYSNKLNSNKLQLCYELAPLRVKQFLDAEIEHIIQKIRPDDVVLDLGCGYGRAAIKLIDKARQVVGVDISSDNIKHARELFGNYDTLSFIEMNAIDLLFPDNSFDVTICIQNGISAFHVEPLKLIDEALRVTKSGGKVYFSTYSEKFWNERVNWFQIQADHGLIGAVDYDKTKNGVIVCKDGFQATTFSCNEFRDLTSQFNVIAEVYEIDNSILFCEIEKI